MSAKSETTYPPSKSEKKGFWLHFVSIFENIGIDPNDSDDLKLQKAILVAISISIAIFGVIWGAVYVYLGAINSAPIPVTYSVLSLINVLIFSRTRKIVFYRSSQLVLIIFIPFFLMISLGGFASSSVVIVWSLLAPLGALLFADFKKARYWFGLYLILLVIAGFVDYFNQSELIIGSDATLIFYILNLGAVSTILFYSGFYFVQQKTKAFDLLNRLAENQFSDLINKLNIEEESTSVSHDLSSPVLFMMIKKSGIAFYSKVFSDQKFDDQLVSGFLTAINAFSMETFGTKFIREISYQDFHLIFDIVNDCRIVYAFKGDHTSAEIKFNLILSSLNSKDFEFVFADNANTQNATEKLNDLLANTF